MEFVNSLENRENVKDMLNDLYGLFIKRYTDPKIAWNRFVEFLAIENCGRLFLDINIDWLRDIPFRDQVFSIYKPDLLKSEYYDNLGDFYLKKEEKNEEYKLDFIPERVLDKKVGTGRRLMTIHKIAPNTILFGIEEDLNLYRIALINFAIYNINCFLFHDSSLKVPNQWNKEEELYKNGSKN